VTHDPIDVEPLDRRKHHLQSFDCGNERLTRWLQAGAGQTQRKDVTRTYVAVDGASRVVGYYTLVAGQVEHGDAPAAVRKGVSPHFPVPVGLVARLAVATTHQGQGLGTDLLRDALRRILAASEHVGIRAVLVDAIDERAAVFYRRLGFEAATPDGLTLMVPLAAVRAALAG
jgi:GNAT superfamily N-acetyltransferase